MEKLILHRNYGSPYCQKIMAMLGYADLEWCSELTTKGVPRPVQEALSGNYSRRVPILQVGSDVYCDTKEICHKIAEVSGNKTLSYYHLSENQQKLSDELESKFGLAVMGLLNPKEMIFSYFKHIPFKDAYEFLKDRMAIKNRMKGKSPLDARSKQEWEEIVIPYFQKINDILEENSFFSGESTPNYTDFTAYTNIWYSYRLNKLKYAKGLSNIKEWLKQMDQFVSKNYTELTKGESLNIALNSEPKAINSSYLNSKNINKETSVVVNDELAFIMEPLKGELVGENDFRYILKRQNDKVGTVHIHIPKKSHGACG